MAGPEALIDWLILSFQREATTSPGKTGAGGIIIVLDQEDHAVFTREHLFMCMDIQLAEALCGFQKPLATLEN